ncbi:phenylalanyl-tRNA synthetase beta chain [Sphaeroforma arctica JP610]|uniref:phenylalanine--tRNA ligase n=1 Tax=Sphaeroforma arctica JP610 TaxID=667725 RepID=A0A0L0GDT0_9EUKA|nr:phenylalanyl-tRNA synthetase beta chain [Sphaeroforma arctica JP610]KNC87155.1 phenylalanyl-tRNA synthetase beta chain [Sphaeroforma arctica JP610]|eukprot:XP_014161057.1 phenylalanyl-tRNA synthetase beta chain [Sphaeroforma arctica JP610]
MHSQMKVQRRRALCGGSDLLQNQLYDLLCIEGLVRGIRIFERNIEPPRYVSSPATQKIIVEKETQQIRPYVVGAVLRNVTFNEDSYASFIDLQDKLHMNICRKRTLASIGTHDLDTIKGPFYYRAQAPKDIKFKALKQTEETTADELMEKYRTDQQLKHFLHIIEDSPVYPVVYDSQDIVCSLPPIINSEYSKITLETRNVFIECTATDRSKANTVVDQIVSMFSEYCDTPFTYEQVDIEYPDGTTEITPKMEYRLEKVPVAYLNKRVGIEETAESIAAMLDKMCIPSTATDAETIEVEVPPTRADILHACDIMEDVGIAYGYDNIKMTIPDFQTVAVPNPLNKLTDLLRNELAQCGFTEALTFALCSLDESFKFMRQPQSKKAVTISNPATFEFQMARLDLAPGILKTIASNRSVPIPLKIFEVSDVVMQCETSDTGCKNERRLCAAYYGQTSGMEVIHGLIDRIFQVLSVEYDAAEGYSYESVDHPMFLAGRSGSVLFKGKVVGQFGVVHPEVLGSFELKMPTSLVEINAEIFL